VRKTGNNTIDDLGEGSHAQFEIEIGQRGPDAVNVKLLDDK
jgi:cold shock CspA family protein